MLPAAVAAGAGVVVTILMVVFMITIIVVIVTSLIVVTLTVIIIMRLSLASPRGALCSCRVPDAAGSRGGLGLLGGSWGVISGVISKVTIVITHIRGLL